METLLAIILSAASFLGLYSPDLGAATYVRSAQLAASPTNGQCLTTNGSSNVWGSCSAGGGATSVATSSAETKGFLSYWTSTAATPATLGQVATTSLTINAPLTTSGTPGALVGGTNLTIDITAIKAADLDLVDITLADLTFDVGSVDTTEYGYLNGVTSAIQTQLDGKASFAWPFTISAPQSGVSTSTLLRMFGGASTTDLTAKTLKVGGTATTSISVAGAVTIPSGLTVSDLTSAMLLTGAGGLMAEYTGTSCTNQFVRSLSALGVATCATVGSADVSLANLTATDTSLTFSGTYNGSTARTIGVNLGHSFTWTAVHDFGGATSIEMVNGIAPTVDAVGEFALDTTNNFLLIATSTDASFPAVIPTKQYSSFSYATTTWTGTTTIQLGPAYFGETWTDIKCYTDAGTLNARIGDGTNYTSMFAITSTVAGDHLASYAFTTDEKREIQLGTPATAPTKASCTVEKYSTRT